ncbi:MAG: GWxTD domain-containing protein, partial [Candidatus Aminicenantes bacterium]
MKKRKKTLIFVIIVSTAIMLLTMACGPGTRESIETEPPDSTSVSQIPKELYKDSFFEKARFIMTKQEIEIYKHLPDKAGKEQFIEEFWKKRDPNPETEENESREEFEERITYANKWFKEHSKDRGWDTQRGRILLQLGFPDRREFGELDDTVR